MDMMFHYVVIWIVSVPGIVIGTVSITFEPTKPPLGDSVTISCELTGSSSAAVTWNFENTITTCGGSSCVPNPTTHTHSMGANVFNLSLSSVAVANCINYTCLDALITTDTTSSDLSVAFFNKNDITTTEPGANTDGSISVTTGCVLSATDLTIAWYKIEDGIETDYTTDRPSPADSTARSTCTRTCHTDEDKKVTSGFTHTEYTGSDYVEVEYKVTVSHSSYTDSADQFTWTSAKYRLKGSTTTSSTTTSTSSNTTTPTVNASTTSTTTNLPTTTAKTTCDNTCIIIIGVCLFVILLALFFVCYLLRRRRNNKKKKDNSKVNNSNQSYDNDMNLSDIVMTFDTSGGNSGYGENNRL